MIRKTEKTDLDIIMAIYDEAKNYMHNSGNPKQWNGSYPEKELIADDIKNGNSYVIFDEQNTIYGVFTLIKGVDPAYLKIERGNWISDKPYATIHRIASNGRKGGILKEAVDFSLNVIPHLRIDTHKENQKMRQNLNKLGFIECGIIHLNNGDPRIAYELIK